MSTEAKLILSLLRKFRDYDYDKMNFHNCGKYYDFGYTDALINTASELAREHFGRDLNEWTWSLIDLKGF